MSESKWLWLFLFFSFFAIFARLLHHILQSAFVIRHSTFGFRLSAFGIQYSAYNWICLLFFSFFLSWIDHMSLCISFLFFSFLSSFVAKGRSSHFRNDNRGWVGLIHGSPCNTIMFRQIRCSLFLRQFIFIFNSVLLFFRLFTFYNWLENGNENEPKTEHTRSHIR